MNDEATGDDPPPFYTRLSDNKRFTGLIGPFYERIVEDGTRLCGVRLGVRHCNGAGIVHGGFLMTMADSLVGHAVGHGTKRLGVTVRLTADFAATARAGDWLEGFAILRAVEDDSAYADAELSVSGRLVFRAQAVFRLMARHRAG
jgi:acyl-coenzyme A thioesterase PaaI-like protein